MNPTIDAPTQADPPLPTPTPQEFRDAFAALEREVGKAVIGHRDALRSILVAFFAGGHVLIEGVPGIGKTLIVRSLGEALDAMLPAWSPPHPAKASTTRWSAAASPPMPCRPSSRPAAHPNWLVHAGAS